MLEIVPPVLADKSPNPVKETADRWGWNIDCADNCPKRLKGYLVVRTRPQGSTGDYRLQDLALPVEAQEVPADPAAPRWVGNYLVGGTSAKMDVEVVKGVRWPELCAASNATPPARVARSLLETLSMLHETFTATEIMLEHSASRECVSH